MYSNDQVQGQGYFGHCNGALLRAKKAEIIYSMQFVILDSEEIKDVSRCSLAVGVGGFTEPRKILVSLLCGMVVRSEVSRFNTHART